MTATSVADPTAKATAAVNVIPASTIGVAISPSSATIVAAATYQFTATLTGTNNTAVTWSAAAGTISSTGRFTAPSVTANTNVLVTATSVVDPAANARANVTVTPASSLPPPPPPPTGADNRYCDPGNIPNFGSDDAPAVMPTACYHTATTSTPSAGAVIQVAPGSSVSTALNSANCGDTLVLQSGQTYSGFNLPAKNCDAGHYITIRTSGYASLPAEGTRVTPCSAGVSSLPGRPAINCPSSRNVMALIAGVAGQSKIIGNTPGANYYRLIGLEVADTGANGAAGGYYDAILLNTSDHIVIDRCWIHGTPTGEDIKGVDFENSSYIAVIDSYISDIHSKISGYGRPLARSQGLDQSRSSTTSWKPPAPRSCGAAAVPQTT